MNQSITHAAAITRYPELQELVAAREAGWVFRPLVNEDGVLEGIAGNRNCRQYTDAIFIFDRTNVSAARVLDNDYGGGCTWVKQGADIQEVVHELLELPEPGEPKAPTLVKRSSLLWTP